MAGRRVYLAARDLTFRAKLAALVARRGGELVRDAAACEIGIVEIDSPAWEDRVRQLVGRGVPVLAFGPHVRADLLRAARDAGADAVPNSQVARRLEALL